MSPIAEIPQNAGKWKYAPRAIVEIKCQLRCYSSNLGNNLLSCGYLLIVYMRKENNK